MDDRALERQVRAHFAAWNRHDAQASVQMLAPDCVFSDNGRQLLGRDAVLAATRRYFDRYPDLRLELLSLYVASNAVLTEWRVHTSRPQELTGIAEPRLGAHATGSRVDEFSEDGLVRSSTLFWDTTQLLRNYGLMPREEASVG